MLTNVDILNAIKRPDLAKSLSAENHAIVTGNSNPVFDLVVFENESERQQFSDFSDWADADNKRRASGTVLDDHAKKRLGATSLGVEHRAWLERCTKTLRGPFTPAEQFIFGLSLPIRAFEYLSKHKSLWPKMAVPLGMFVVVYLAVITACYFVLSAWVTSSLLFWPAMAACCVGGVYATNKVYTPVAGPFLEAICDEIETNEKEHMYSTWSRPTVDKRWIAKTMVQGLTHGLLFLLISPLAALLLICVPVVGWLITLVAFGMIANWEISFDYMASLRGWTFSEKLSFIKRYFFMFLGLTVWTGPAALVPIVVPFVLGPAIVAGSLCLVWFEAEYKFQPVDRRPRTALAS